MENRSKLRFMKITCIAGIIADGLWALALIFPGLYQILTRNPGFDPDMQIRTLMGIAGSLMTAWTLLLIWVYKDPVERRVVMLLTAFPILFGITLSSVANVFWGDVSIGDTGWIVAKSSLLLVMFSTSFVFGKQLSHNNN